MRIKLLALTIGLLLMSGCHLRYPSIGVPANRVKATDWSGQVPQRCCFVALDIDTNMKEYQCVELVPKECRKLLSKGNNSAKIR
jgi:hypothetical protein